MAAEKKSASKLDRLKETLERAQARLAQEEPALLARLKVLDEEKQRLQSTWDKAVSAHRKAYEELQVVRGKVEMTTERMQALTAAIESFFAAEGLAADASAYARSYARGLVEADPVVAEKRKISNDLYKAEEKARAAVWDLDRMGGSRYLATSRLHFLREAVTSAKEAVDDYPRQLENARENTRRRREEERIERDKDKARYAFQRFKWTPPTTEESD